MPREGKERPSRENEKKPQLFVLVRSEKQLCYITVSGLGSSCFKGRSTPSPAMKVSKMKKVEMKWRLMKSGGEKRVRSDEKSNEVQNLQLSVPVEVVGQKLYLDIKAVIHRIS